MRFWDSSALVPLLVTQPLSSKTDKWVAEDGELAVWTLTPIELASAVLRLVREGALQETAANKAESRIDELLGSCHVVIDVEAVEAQARRLLRLHPLRAADAMQLGAAWEWVAGRPTGRIFHTLDTRLALAARREGFRVIPEPR
ncbi:MAG: type II toxin-antitoxin system VapC family toxin [Deltaproteobacteria bacterium]|nr:MAG: type II toxin-antitoxin system VapC family toxin [Deltaproteobacteria bacterium]